MMRRLYVLRALVLVGIVLMLGALAATPLVLTAFFKASAFNPQHPHAVAISTVCVYAIAAPCVAALFALLGVCRHLSAGSAGYSAAARRLKIIAGCALAETGIFWAVQAVLSAFFQAFLYALTVIPAVAVPWACAVTALTAWVLADVLGRVAPAP
ncbi:MAG: DUF2975 domain-containing protein [Christensenellales bacterium]|jgi:hypothetical protein